MIDRNIRLSQNARPPMMNKKKQKMNFFIFAYWHDPKWRHFVGASVKIWDLAVNLHQLGHRVVMFLPKCGFQGLNPPFSIIEIPIINLPGMRAFSFNFFLVLRLISFYVNSRPDVVYLRRTNTIVPLIFARLTRALFFFEVNDDPYRNLYINRNISSFIRNKLSIRLDLLNLKLSDRIYIISREIMEKISKLNPFIDSSKFTLMPSGANTDVFFPIPRSEAVKAAGLDSEKEYVGFVGTMLCHQGIDVLIQAAAEIINQRPECRFLVIGEGPMRRKWQEWVERIGLGRVFLFTGQISYRHLPAWINAMDVCVAPYSAHAGFRSPVKIFDYLACGKPVVASRIMGTTDMFSDIPSVFLVTPECPKELCQATVALLKDPIFREDIGRYGRQWITANYSRLRLAEHIAADAGELKHKP